MTPPIVVGPDDVMIARPRWACSPLPAAQRHRWLAVWLWPGIEKLGWPAAGLALRGSGASVQDAIADLLDRTAARLGRPVSMALTGGERQ
jgi:hypothetical protein